MGFLSYALGTTLDIKPIIACRSGKTDAVGRVRGFENALNEVVGAIIGQIEQGQLLEPLITLVYGGELSGLVQVGFPLRCVQKCIRMATLRC